MAEKVQALMERMVSPLRDLRDRGIFSEDEIRSIVSRRRESEYLLQKVAVRRSDYLRYIEQEILLERLRKLRKQKVLQEWREKMRTNQPQEGHDETIDRDGKKKLHAYQTSGPGDSHIVSNIHFLYQRFLKKFHYPVEVILNYAEFAKEHKSFHVMSRVYAEGLQRHPREEGLWIQAASFEFFGYVAQDDEKNESTKVVGSSIQNARVLMQRGLRINGKTSQELWLQYFALELHYVMKLQGRKEILEMGATLDGKDDDSVVQDSSNEDKKAVSRSISNTLLLPSQIIYKNAIKSIPNSLSFRLRFIETCRMFPQTGELENYVIDSIERDFRDSAEAWVSRISFAEEQMKKQNKKLILHTDEAGTEQAFLAIPVDGVNYEEPAAKKKRLTMEDTALAFMNQALDTIPTPKMYLECARYLQLRIRRLLDSHANQRDIEDEQPEDVTYLISVDEDVNLAVKRHSDLLKELYSKARDKGVYTSSLALDQVDFLLSNNKMEEADKLLGQCIGNGDVNSHLFIRWANLSQQMAERGFVPTFSASCILRKGLNATPIHNRDAFMLISTELMKQLMTQPPSLKVEQELKLVFQKLLLVSQGLSIHTIAHKDCDDENEVKVNVAETFLAYLVYTIPTSNCSIADNEAVRSIYNRVIFHSSFGKSCLGKTDEEVLAMKSFFDTCLHFEKSVAAVSEGSTKTDSKKQKKQKKQKLFKLYEGVIAFFEDKKGESDMRNIVDRYQREFDNMKFGL